MNFEWYYHEEGHQHHWHLIVITCHLLLQIITLGSLVNLLRYLSWIVYCQDAKSLFSSKSIHHSSCSHFRSFLYYSFCAGSLWSSCFAGDYQLDDHTSENWYYCYCWCHSSSFLWAASQQLFYWWETWVLEAHQTEVHHHWTYGFIFYFDLLKNSSTRYFYFKPCRLRSKTDDQ